MNEALTRQLLQWLAASPRDYRETMDAWRTCCPRLSIWEDAQAERLLEVVQTASGAEVRLTEEGRKWLATSSQA